MTPYHILWHSPAAKEAEMGGLCLTLPGTTGDLLVRKKRELDESRLLAASATWWRIRGFWARGLKPQEGMEGAGQGGAGRGEHMLRHRGLKAQARSASVLLALASKYLQDGTAPPMPPPAPALVQAVTLSPLEDCRGLAPNLLLPSGPLLGAPSSAQHPK